MGTEISRRDLKVTLPISPDICIAAHMPICPYAHRPAWPARINYDKSITELMTLATPTCPIPVFLVTLTGTLSAPRRAR